MLRPYTTVREYEDDSVDIDLVTLSSIGSVTGTATSRGSIIATGSDTLFFSGFGYTGAVTGLELHLHISRLARIQDRVIRFYNAGALIGTDLSDLSAGDVHVYVLDGARTIESDFGVVVDVGPHTQYPSANTVYIRSVSVDFKV